jgi:hypothetical protein
MQFFVENERQEQTVSGIGMVAGDDFCTLRQIRLAMHPVVLGKYRLEDADDLPGSVVINFHAVHASIIS